jgi:hypothetical protein
MYNQTSAKKGRIHYSMPTGTVVMKKDKLEMMRKSIKYTLFTFVLLPMLLYGCSKKSSEGPVILKFNGKPVYMAELEIMGQLAISKKGYRMGTEEGRAYFKQIAPNVYESLITVYTLKYVSELEGYLPTPEEVQEEFVAFKEKLDAQKMYDSFMGRFSITEEQLKETLQYQLSINKLQAAKIQSFVDEDPSEQEVRQYYYENKRLFRYPNKMRASHIFLSAPKEGDEEKRRNVRMRIEQMKKMIGENPAKTFIGFAQKYSEDSATKQRGGDLGFFDRTLFNEPFTKAAFALKEGEVSDVVETDFGFHLIWATDHQQSETEALKEITLSLKREQAGEKFNAWLEEEKSRMDIVRLFDPVAFQLIPETNP